MDLPRSPCAGLRWAVGPVFTLDIDGRVRTLDGVNAGAWTGANPLVTETSVPPDVDGLWITPSGRLEMPHRTWGREGQAVFEAWLGSLAGVRSPRSRVRIRPHHEDVLSDLQRCLGFLRAMHEGAGLAFDPAALIAPSMLPYAADHMARVAETLGAMPGLDLMVLTNLEQGADGLLTPSPLHRGALDGALLATVAQEAARRGTGIALVGVEVEAQIELLRRWVGL